MSDTNTQASVSNEANPTENMETTDASTAEETALNATEGAESQQASEAVKQAEKKLRKLKLKIDGQEIEEEFDPEDNDYLTKQLQLAKVAQKRMGEYSALEKDVQEFFRLLKEDPKKVLTDPNIGLDLKQFAASIIEEEIARAKKSPEQLEREKLEAELKSLKAERETERKTAQQKDFEKLQKQEAERYDVLFTKALEAGGLPKSPYVVKKMADYVALGIQEGLDVSPEDVLPLVKEEIENDIKEMFKAMPDEIIEQMVGTDTISRIRKKRVAARQAAPAAPVNKIQDTGKTKEAKEPQKKLTIKDFFGV